MDRNPWKVGQASINTVTIVSHDTLVSELFRWGFQDSISDWVKSFLANRILEVIEYILTSHTLLIYPYFICSSDISLLHILCWCILTCTPLIYPYFTYSANISLLHIICRYIINILCWYYLTSRTLPYFRALRTSTISQYSKLKGRKYPFH